MSGRRAPAKATAAVPDWKGFAVSGVRLGGLYDAWECAKAFFYPERMARAEEAASSGSDARLAFAIIVLAGFVIFAIGLLYSLESIYVGNLLLETLGEVTGTEQPRFDLAVMAPSAAFQFVLYVALGSVITIAHEGVAFLIFRLSGGGGTLGQQLHAGGVVWLAAAMSLGASLLLPLPCLQWLAVASMAAITLGYVLIFMSARVYSRVHGVSPIHSAAVTLLLLGPRILVWLAAVDVLAGVTGISPMIQPGA